MRGTNQQVSPAEPTGGMMGIRSQLTALIVVVVGIIGVTVESEQRRAGTEADACPQARTVARLARIYGSADLALIENDTNAVCASGKTSNTMRWSHKEKERMRSGDNWYYPNGNDAIRSARTWLYPNQHVAKSTGGTWSYPDGQHAKSATGNWTRPDRDTQRFSTEELRTWACSRVPKPDCTRLSSEIGDGQTDEQILAALELAWLAR